ncbi:sedoheptulose 7-phosphate cyclase [Candidatus Thioglobus sp.]|nr:sedoheptulose 7-phosphate cyclase [Candidatus Thioglobus sp.]
MCKDEDGIWFLKAKQNVGFFIKNSLNLFDINNKDLLSHGSQGEGVKRLVVVDTKVHGIYGNKIQEYLKHNKVNFKIVIIDAIENQKNLKTLIYLLDEIESFGLNRRDEPIIAVGGGVLLDIVGLAANLYRRGVPYIRIPTTLLSLVDASVGAKTGINFNERRNRLGSYYLPLASYLDTSFLKTLEPIEISSGLGEILKMAVVKDKKLFDILQLSGKKLYKEKFDNCYDATEVIARTISGMKDELQQNLWEQDLERYVDFGHSFSPILEIRSLNDSTVESLTHGQAVTLDVIFSCVISHIRNMFTQDDVLSVIALSRAMGLPVFHPYFGNVDFLTEALNDTIKHRNGNQNLPIPIGIGSSIFINDLKHEEIIKSIDVMKDLVNI